MLSWDQMLWSAHSQGWSFPRKGWMGNRQGGMLLRQEGLPPPVAFYVPFHCSPMSWASNVSPSTIRLSVRPHFLICKQRWCSLPYRIAAKMK